MLASLTRVIIVPTRVLRQALPAIVLVLAILAPFREKAFTIDDTIFLYEARQAVADPLHPTAFDMVWDKNVPVRGSSSPSGPIMAWLLVPTILAGGSEPVAHLTALAALALAVLATVALAMRLGLGPAWAMVAGLVLAATPAALGMAGTVMPDVPAMALGVIGLERLVAWRQDGRWHQAVSATILLGIAPLARSHLALLLGVAILLFVGDPFGRMNWRLRWTRWVPLGLAPLLTFALWFVTRDTHPAGGLVAGTESVSGWSKIAPNLVAFTIHWVVAVPLALPWSFTRSRALLARWWVFALATAGAGVVIASEHRPIGFILVGVLAVLAGLGLAVLWDILTDALKRRDGPQFALGSWLLVALVIAPYAHLPAKYLLASAPAAAILVAREISTHDGLIQRVALGVTCTLGVALGIAILQADATFAGLGRRAAAELIAPHVAAGQRVWFAGHWGFQWYAERAGARPVTLTPPYPEKGDLFVWSLNSSAGREIDELLMLYQHRSFLARIEDHEPGGRLLDPRCGAGFFSNPWGYLPWAWGDGVLDDFELWRIDQQPWQG